MANEQFPVKIILEKRASLESSSRSRKETNRASTIRPRDVSIRFCELKRSENNVACGHTAVHMDFGSDFWTVSHARSAGIAYR